jgi:hypothetical protein
MNPVFQRLILLVLCANLLACSTLQSLPPAAWGAVKGVSPPAGTGSSGALQVGDKLVLATAQQARLVLRLTALQADALVGTNEADGSVLRVPSADIVSLQRQEIDVLRTALLVLAGVALVALVATALGTSKLLNAGTAAL